MGKGGGPFGAVVRPLRVLVTFVSEEGQEGTGEKKTKNNQIERERSTKERRSSGSLQQSASTRTAAVAAA